MTNTVTKLVTCCYCEKSHNIELSKEDNSKITIESYPNGMKRQCPDCIILKEDKDSIDGQLMKAGHYKVSERKLIIAEFESEKLDFKEYELDEICMCEVCEAVLLPDDEVYEDDSGDFLCDDHSVLCDNDSDGSEYDGYMKFTPDVIVKWKRK